MHLVSCTNTHRDVTDLVNHEMVKNAKTWISSEWNTIFLRNKEFLNLCFRWHILRSYCFVAEVTFKLLTIVANFFVSFIKITALLDLSVVRISHAWRGWGTPQNFCLAFIDTLQKQIFRLVILNHLFMATLLHQKYIS